ncbi:MAG: DnaB-like helicase C-terminal domain-containing protein [Umezawaea sp.]
MHSLLQSRRIRGAAGEPLPAVFKTLEDNGTRFLRGQLVLVAAGPGTGKSGFTLTYALRSGVSAMYFSADSDAFVQLTRSISILTGWTLEASAKAVLADELGDVRDRLTGLPIRLSYSASPSLGEIETTIEAYEEVYGDYPDLIVIDNITNVRTQASDEDGDPFSGLEGLMDYLHTMARETQACVIGLHHVTGSYNDADKPIPLSGVKGQISRVPEMVLTMHKRSGGEFDSDVLCVSTVKNRGGRADASGHTYAELEFDGERMLIRDSVFT